MFDVPIGHNTGLMKCLWKRHFRFEKTTFLFYLRFGKTYIRKSYALRRGKIIKAIRKRMNEFIKFPVETDNVNRKNP